MNTNKPENNKSEEKKNNSLPAENKKEDNKKTSDNKLLPGQRNGLYAALGVCLVSVAVAALVTYMGFTDIGNDSELYTADTSLSESIVSAVSDDDPLIDGQRIGSTTVEEAESQVTEETIISRHEGENEKVSEAENTAAPSDEEKAEVNIDHSEKINETVKANTEPEETSETSNDAYTVSENFARPTEGFDVRNEYSSNLVYCETMKDYRTHNGIDIVTNDNENVLSVANGKVVDVYEDLLLGNVVVIEHGEYIFRYCGLNDNISVIPGDIVSQGSIIGSAGEVPYEKGEASHLHLEAMKDSLYIDPAPLFN